MTARLPSLPYKLDALEPYISRQTLAYHHGKHHYAYISKLNALIKGTSWEKRGPFEILIATTNTHIFNNAAQSWSHAFFWKSIAPNGGGEASGILGEVIRDDFGSYAYFRDAFLSAATSNFGSGWTWLVSDGGQLKILSTSNAETPFAQGVCPLLTVDVWEHAYYLDYQNRRDAYIEAILDHLINWSFAERNYEKSLSAHETYIDADLKVGDADPTAPA